MDMMNTAFVASLLPLDKGEADVAFQKNTLVYDARNLLTEKAIAGGYERILWLDSDMTFTPDLLKRLSADLDEGRDMVCGIFFKRIIPCTPCIYKAIYATKKDGKIYPHADAYLDYPRDSVFEIAGCGFGATMMNVSLLNRIKERHGLPFSPFVGYGEDFSFCMRVAELGVPMYCDSRVKVGHVGYAEYNEETYEGLVNNQSLA